MIKGLIFDCDGTLVDSMATHWMAWQKIMRRHGFQWTEEQFYSLGGVPSRDILRLINQEQGLDLNPLAVAREKEEIYESLLDQVGLIEPIVNIARENFGRIPLAVASGGTHRIIRKVLERNGLISLFGAIVTSENVSRQKPAPDIFLEAALQLGVNPLECRAYEDTNLGMQAILAAGMEAVDVRLILAEQSCRDAA